MIVWFAAADGCTEPWHVRLSTRERESKCMLTRRAFELRPRRARLCGQTVS